MSEVLKELADGLEAATSILNAGRTTQLVKLSATFGKVWTRIVCVDLYDGKEVEHSRRAWGFMDTDGKLWKNAGWKAPAKNKPRGVVADLHNATIVQGWRYGGVQ